MVGISVPSTSAASDSTRMAEPLASVSLAICADMTPATPKAISTSRISLRWNMLGSILPARRRMVGWLERWRNGGRQGHGAAANPTWFESDSSIVGVGRPAGELPLSRALEDSLGEGRGLLRHRRRRPLLATLERHV